MSDLDAVLVAFQQHITESVVGPIRARLDSYIEALEDAVSTVASLDVDEPSEPQPAEPQPTDPEAGGEPEGTEATRSAARLRFRYADRFHGAFGPELFDAARSARDELFAGLSGVAGDLPSLPDTLLVADRDSAAGAPELVRPGWPQRLMAAVGRSGEREVPVRRLAELYSAELARRLEPATNEAARLTAVAMAEIRGRLHEGTELSQRGASPPPRLGGAADAVVRRLESVADTVQEEFGRALRASVIRVPERSVDAARERASTRQADILDGWTTFEEALMANVVSEAALARALASMEAVVAEAGRELEAVRQHRGVAPLERLAGALDELGERAESVLKGDVETALEALASDAERLFAAELPRVTALLPRLEERIDGLVVELAAIPGQVPDDLHISEHPVPEIPDRARKLELRDAPLEALLNTACGGVLPRWLEKSMASAREELEAMNQALDRVEKAVEFQIRAPARGGFEDEVVQGLVMGITERAAAQVEDLRTQALTSIDALVIGLEKRTREEADALRSAVANRDFVRIHSEIAEEQAARQFSTGIERARDAATAVERGARSAWGSSRRIVAAVQDWAQRQLGVREVERADMLESLEQSLIGEDQQVVALPAMYRQLFDVEGDVPWDELLVPRDEELAVIRRAFDRWVEDRSASLAVVGEKGSGKSTLLRLAEQRVFHGTRVVHPALGRSIDDPDELAERMAAAFELDGPDRLMEEINGQPPTVAIVEDLHHLFVRALGGFDALEAFLETVAATSANVLWVVTVDEFAWRYLNRVVGLDAHFVHTVTTTNLSAEKLEAAIMARHEVSGFALKFETEQPAAEDGRWRRLLGREAKGELTRKESQRRRFFQQLAGIAEGNIVLALFYWLRAIRRMEEHVLVLGDPEIIELEFLDRLPLAHLHSLAAIILHGGLSEATHQRVFQLTPMESRLQLSALEDSHMVFLSADGEYKVNKVLYRPFIRLLTTRNIF